jgi:hypothetical protein
MDEVEGIWKETVFGKVTYYDGICIEGWSRRHSARIVGVLLQIRTQHLPNMILKICHNANKIFSHEFSGFFIYNVHQWCLHLIVVVGFERSWDADNYASGSIATGRVTHTGQVKG